MSVMQSMCMLCGNSGRIVENEIMSGRPFRYMPCPVCRAEAYRRQAQRDDIEADKAKASTP